MSGGSAGTGFLRILKGQFLGPLFLVFGFGILVEFALLPAVWLAGKLRGPASFPMQGIHRFFFVAWLGLMKAGGLLEFREPKGRLADGPAVIVANHPGLFDVVVLIRLIPRMSVLVKNSLASNLILRPVLKLSGYVSSPVEGDLGSSLRSLKAARKALQAGYRFMLFPEGTRSPEGGMFHFHPGAFKIAQMANVPVQPVILRNRPPFMHGAAHWYYPPHPRSVLEIEFLEPIPPPGRGGEKEMAARLEAQFRRELGLPEETGPAGGEDRP